MGTALATSGRGRPVATGVYAAPPLKAPSSSPFTGTAYAGTTFPIARAMARPELIAWGDTPWHEIEGHEVDPYYDVRASGLGFLGVTVDGKRGGVPRVERDDLQTLRVSSASSSSPSGSSPSGSSSSGTMPETAFDTSLSLSSSSLLAGIDSTTLLLGAAGIGLLFLLKKRGRRR